MIEHSETAPVNRIVRLEMLTEELVKMNSDHEKRLRSLERVIGYGSGSVGMMLFLLKMMKVI